MTNTSRRAVTASIAWSLPAVTVAAAAPAIAASDQPQYCLPLSDPASHTITYYPQRSDASSHTVTIQSDVLQWDHDVRDELGGANQDPSSYVVLITNTQTGQTVHIDQVSATWSVDSGTVSTGAPVAGQYGDFQEVDAIPLYERGNSPITMMGINMVLTIAPDAFSETDPWSIQLTWNIQTDCGDARGFFTTQAVTTTAQGEIPLGPVGLYG